MTVWDVKEKNRSKLSLAATRRFAGGQDPGFFTSISSIEGRHAIIWALARPQYVPGPMALFAFKPSLWRGNSPTQDAVRSLDSRLWNASNGNANLVPAVANGKVYVASYKELNIFGLGARRTWSPCVTVATCVPHHVRRSDGQRHARDIRGSLLTLKSADRCDVARRRQRCGQQSTHGRPRARQTRSSREDIMTRVKSYGRGNDHSRQAI